MSYGDIIVLALLALIVIMIIKSLLKDRKKGVHSGCGGNCSACAAHCVHSLPKKLS